MLQYFSFTIKQHQSTYQPQKNISQQCNFFKKKERKEQCNDPRPVYVALLSIYGKSNVNNLAS